MTEPLPVWFWFVAPLAALLAPAIMVWQVWRLVRELDAEAAKQKRLCDFMGDGKGPGGPGG